VSLLSGVVGVLAAITGLNLLLTLGVVRRLRELTALLSDSGGAAIALPVGAQVEPFSAVTVDGDVMDRASIGGPTLVAAVSPTCKPCQDRLPQLIASAAGMPGGRDRVFALVISADEQERAAMVTQLRAVARVAIEAPNGPVARALGVRGYPTFALLDLGGRVLGSGFAPDQVPYPAVAR
jgi:hypothetical protein